MTGKNTDVYVFSQQRTLGECPHMLYEAPRTYSNLTLGASPSRQRTATHGKWQGEARRG